jgi:hypothetical protein
MEEVNILQNGKMDPISILRIDRGPSIRRPQGARLRRKDKNKKYSNDKYPAHHDQLIGGIVDTD